MRALHNPARVIALLLSGGLACAAGPARADGVPGADFYVGGSIGNGRITGADPAQTYFHEKVRLCAQDQSPVAAGLIRPGARGEVGAGDQVEFALLLLLADLQLLFQKRPKLNLIWRSLFRTQGSS